MDSKRVQFVLGGTLLKMRLEVLCNLVELLDKVLDRNLTRKISVSVDKLFSLDTDLTQFIDLVSLHGTKSAQTMISMNLSASRTQMRCIYSQVCDLQSGQENLEYVRVQIVTWKHLNGDAKICCDNLQQHMQKCSKMGKKKGAQNRS